MIDKQYIKQLMKDHNLSQRRLAEKLGVSESLISHIKAGRKPITSNLILRIFDAFGLRVDFIRKQLTKKKG